MTGRQLRRLVGEVLVESSADRPLGPHLLHGLHGLTTTQLDELLLAAARHGVTGLLGAAADGTPGLAAHVRQGVERARRRVLRDHLRALGELAVVGAHLDAAQVPWMLVKGPALAAVAYPQPHLREYADLDVLVTEQTLHDVLQLLGTAGFAVDGPSLAHLRTLGAGEIRLRSPAGLPVDLHWDLVNDPGVRAAFAVPPAAEVLGRARPVDLPGTSLLTLDPVDTLLHVAVHACTSGGWRLLWLRDVLQTAACVEAVPELVLARSRRWGVELVLEAMLARSTRVLQPGSAVAPRSPAPWVRLLTLVDAAFPVQHATGRPSLTRITTKSTRRDSRTSAAELVRRSGHFARDVPRLGSTWATPAEPRQTFIGMRGHR